jgi:hypothetical protein
VFPARSRRAPKSRDRKPSLNWSLAFKEGYKKSVAKIFLRVSPKMENVSVIG